MIGMARRELRLPAVVGVAALLLCLALSGVAAVSAQAGGLKTYKGGSKKDKRARLLLKVKTGRKGVPKRVVLKLSRARASCAVGPNEGEFSPRRFGWRLPYAMPVIAERSPKGHKINRFEGSQTNGGAPTGGEEEEFNVVGAFSRNRRSAHVTIERQYTVEGSAVESSEEFVTCTYRAAFKVKLKR